MLLELVELPIYHHLNTFAQPDLQLVLRQIVLALQGLLADLSLWLCFLILCIEVVPPQAVCQALVSSKLIDLILNALNAGLLSKFLILAHLVEDLQELGPALCGPQEKKAAENGVVGEYIQQCFSFDLVHLDEVVVPS